MLKKTLLLLLSSLSTLFAVSVEDAFTNGSINGKMELFYYNIEKDNTPKAYATALGGALKYITDTQQPFFATFGFHTSNPVGENENKTKTSLFNNDKDGEPLHALSEANIAYQVTGRVMKLGNLIFNTPMMNEDTTRIVPWSYQGFTYTGKVTKETQVQLKYIWNIRNHTSSEYTKMSASGEIGDAGITMLSFHHMNKDRYNLQAYYYYAPDLYSTFVAQADYSILYSDLLYCFGIQWFKSGNGGEFNKRENLDGGDDINLIATKLSIDGDDWLASLSYSQNFGLSGMRKGYGGLTKTYTTSMVANGRANYKPETWMLKVHYDLPLSEIHSEVALWLTDTKVHDERGKSFFAHYMHYKHSFTKELSLYVRYEHINYDEPKNNDATYFRFITTYKF